MTQEDADEPDDPEPGSEDQSREFRLKAGFRPLWWLLGDLIEIPASESPPPPENQVGRTAGDENGGAQREDGSERKRTKRVRKAKSEPYLVDTRFDDDEFIVTADIPGASREALSVGIDPNTNRLVISEEGTVIERVDLPWNSSETVTAWFNNGVLEIRLESSDA